MAVEDINTKQCSKCNTPKPVSEFCKHIKGRNGLSAVCRTCKSKQNAAYRAVNREHVMATTAKWVLANPERKKAADAAWRAQNPERIKASYAAWAKANPERVKAINTAWTAANPERYKAAKDAWAKANPEKMKASADAWAKANQEKLRVYCHNRRARKRENGGKLSPDLAAKLFKLQRGKCACCSKPLGDDYHLDHIMPLALGGTNTDDNIQLLRQRCNNQKHAKHPIDFMQQRGFLL